MADVEVLSAASNSPAVVPTPEAQGFARGHGAGLCAQRAGRAGLRGWHAVGFILLLELLPLFLAFLMPLPSSLSHAREAAAEAAEDFAVSLAAPSVTTEGAAAALPFWARSRRRMLSLLEPAEMQRSTVMDVLLGAPLEFGEAPFGVEGGEAPGLLFQTLRSTAVAVAASAEAANGGNDPEAGARALQQVVLRLVGTRDQWPTALRARLRDAVFFHAGVPAVTAGNSQLPLEVDIEATSSMATFDLSGPWLRKGVVTASAYVTGHRRIDTPDSSLLLSERPAALDEHVAFRWKAPSLALRCAEGRAAFVRHLVIEQPARMVDEDATLAPRRFVVHGAPAEAAEVPAPSANFSMFLGAFEYSLAAPATQSFPLADAPLLRGLRITFEKPGWGGKYLSLYRVRAFGALASAR